MKEMIYEQLERCRLEELDAEGIHLRHKKSGARIALILNEDENRVFQIAFRTPPSNQKGIPHILEHAVFCGSRKFPVKDPFIELAKGSMNTFLNAMTYPDKTVFPAASQNEKDFQNLMDVYLDAVFYPKLYEREEIFWQEGWNYQLETLQEELSYNGVVYNEMKGAFSSPEDSINRENVRSLFPDTCYAFEAGGDPEAIPTVTYEECLAYHKEYYHPSNCYLYFYGKLSVEDLLDWLDKEYLSNFTKKEISSEVAIQQPFAGRRERVVPYEIGVGESEEARTFLSYNKVVGTTLDPTLSIAFQVLDYVLLSAPGAPIPKRLIEAGIGKDVDGFYDTTFRQPVFSIIARNTDVSEKDRFVGTVENTLRELVEKGMNPKALEAGIHSYEFQLHEADYGGDPKGLVYGLQMLESWLYDDRTPFLLFHTSEVFAFLKEQIGTGYFERLIQTYLLENPHDALVILRPEAGMTIRMEEAQKRMLQQYREQLSIEEWQQLVDRTSRLKTYQEEEDCQEAKDTIPILKRADLSSQILPIWNEERTIAGFPVVFHNIETNGIGYVSFLFDVSEIPEKFLPYVGLLQTVLGSVDTERYSYGSFAHEIDRCTGGIETSLEVYPDVRFVHEKKFRAMFEVHGKAFYENFSILIPMMREMMFCSKLYDVQRLKELIAMLCSQMQTDVLEEAHAIATMRSFSSHSPIARWKEMTEGLSFDQAMKAIHLQDEAELHRCATVLQQLQEYIFRKEHLLISYTAAEEGVADLEKALQEFQMKRVDERTTFSQETFRPGVERELIKTSSQVQFVAQTGNFIDAGYEYHGTMQLLKEILNYDYLWTHVRVKGGAYGCSCGFNRIGEGYFASYRDPNLSKTLEQYRKIPAYLRRFRADEREMTKYIIGTFSNMDRPLSPVAKGDRSMNFYLNHMTEEMVRQERQEILSATDEEIRALADAVEAVLEEDCICVIGNERVLESEKNTLKCQLTML